MKTTSWVYCFRVAKAGVLVALCLVVPSVAGQGAPPSKGKCDYATSAPSLLQKAAKDAATSIVNHNDDASKIIDSMPMLEFLTIADVVAHGKLSPGADVRAAAVVERIQTEAETARTDKQTGATAGAQGSTTAAEKVDFSKLLSLAVENGTIQQAVNGTTLTLSSSPYALVAAKYGDTAQVYKDNQDLTRFGVSATFNMGNTQDVLSNATRRQLAEWSVRYRFNDHSSRSQEFQDYWENNVKGSFTDAALAVGNELSVMDSRMTVRWHLVQSNFFDARNGGAGYIKDFLEVHSGVEKEKLIDELKNEILCRLDTDVLGTVSRVTKSDPNDKDHFVVDDATQQQIQQALLRSSYAEQQAADASAKAKKFLQEMQQRPLIALEYTNVRGTTTPSYSVAKFLLEKNTSENRKLVFNIGASFYSNPDRTMNEQSVRDYSTALSWEALLGRSPFVFNDVDRGQITLSFAGRYQRLLENRHQADKKADIAVVQVKFEIPVFSGVTFPLSISYATASELLKEDHVHANFGFSFDTDKLYQLLAFKKNQAAVQ